MNMKKLDIVVQTDKTTKIGLKQVIETKTVS